MVILPACPGLKVEVAVAGQALKEHDDNYETNAKPKTVTKYVEAVSGANFEIAISFEKPFPDKHAVRAIVYVDGEDVARPIIRESALLKRTRKIQGATLRVEGKRVLRKFRFSKLNVGELIASLPTK